jgi:hypothetical protein
MDGRVILPSFLRRIDPSEIDLNVCVEHGSARLVVARSTKRRNYR